MGILPFRKSVPLTTREILINNRKRLLNNETPFAIKEAYIKLRTSLMFCMTQDGGSVCRVFAVTSPNPSEGKSLTAANIAISFAMLGRRTLLIDADMRKPTQRLLWNVRTTSGLCDYLAAIRPLETARVEDLPLSLERAGGNLCGVVLNDVDIKAIRRSYRYDGRYGNQNAYMDSYGNK